MKLYSKIVPSHNQLPQNTKKLFWRSLVSEMEEWNRKQAAIHVLFYQSYLS